MLGQKRIASVVATGAVLALTLAGCGSESGEGGGGDTRVFRVAFNQNEAHPQAKAILELSDKLEAETGGRYRLELFPDGTLGSQEATIEQVQSCTIDFAFVAGSLLERLAPDFSVVNLP